MSKIKIELKKDECKNAPYRAKQFTLISKIKIELKKDECKNAPYRVKRFTLMSKIKIERLCPKLK